MGYAARHRVSGVSFRGVADKPEAQHPARGRDRELAVVARRRSPTDRKRCFAFCRFAQSQTEVARPSRLARDLIGHRGKIFWIAA